MSLWIQRSRAFLIKLRHSNEPKLYDPKKKYNVYLCLTLISEVSSIFARAKHSKCAALVFFCQTTASFHFSTKPRIMLLQWSIIRNASLMLNIFAVVTGDRRLRMINTCQLRTIEGSTKICIYLSMFIVLR